MTEATSLSFKRQPSLWLAYARALLGRRPLLIAEGQRVPRIEARLSGLAASEAHLAAYRAVCGFTPDGKLPLTYPHVLAMPVHLAMLTSAAFPLRLLGLVHVRDQIVGHRAVGEDEPLDVQCALTGPRETERGQEFDLFTDFLSAEVLAWSETTTFLARRRSAQRVKVGSSDSGSAIAAVEASHWQVDADIGRRYALVSGDYNPIHLTATTARWFGFDRAIAHGMWSVARVVAELSRRLEGQALSVEVAFKLPVYLPARLVLQHWPTREGLGYVLKGEDGVRPHLTGTLTPSFRVAAGG
jgi:acyl dehydratase